MIVNEKNMDDNDIHNVAVAEKWLVEHFVNGVEEALMKEENLEFLKGKLMSLLIQFENARRRLRGK